MVNNLSFFLSTKIEIIVKSVKANRLKPYEYFASPLKELLKNPRENVPEVESKKLMSWSEALRIAAERIKPDKKNLPAWELADFVGQTGYLPFTKNKASEFDLHKTPPHCF